MSKNIEQNEQRAFNKEVYKDLLKLKYLPSWLVLGLLAICAYIPNRLRDLIAIVLASIIAFIPLKPRRIAYANMRTAFSDLSAKECRRLYFKSLAVGISVALSYGQPTFLPRFLLKRSWSVKGKEHLDYALSLNKPIIFVAPHTYAIDRCGLYLSYLGIPMCTMVHRQKNKVYDWFLNQQRLTFGGSVFERSAGLRTLIRELKAHHSCFFLPDEDLGEQSSLFIDFLGVPKATVSTLPKLAKVSQATVMQLFSVYNFKTAKFEVHFSPVFENYPSDDLKRDLRYMNEQIELKLLQHKEQYMWFLRFFKTVPDSSYPDIYANTKISLLKKGKSIDYSQRRKAYIDRKDSTAESK